MRRIFALLLLSASVSVALSAAAKPWRSIRGPNVVVLGQQSTGTLRDIAVEIEQFRIVLGRFVRGARQPPSVPTHVYIFDDTTALRPFVPLYQGKPAVLGGFCHCGSDDDGSFIAVGLSQYAESSPIIFHEYTHFLLRNAIPNLPVWINEGLAEYFSTFELRSNRRDAQIGRAIPGHILRLRDQFLPVAQLLEVDRSSALYNEGSRRSIFYAEAWALTHYLLLDRSDGVAVVNRYLTAVASGTPSEQAFVAGVGKPLKEVDADLRRYVARPVFNAINLTLSERVEVDEPERARVLPAAESDARLGEIQLRVGRVDEGAPRIEAAARSGPEVAQAQLALALLRLGQARDAEAWPPLQKAAALAPDDFVAQYTYALALLRGDADSQLTEQSAVERARTARQALTRALAANHESASALAWLGYANLVMDENLQEARDATARAMTLAPARLDYALQLAEIELRTGEAAAGRRRLLALARSGTDKAVASRAASLVGRIEAGERRVVRDRDLHSNDIEMRLNGESPARERDRSPLPKFRLRDIGEGEERAYGELVEIACGPWGIRFRLRAGATVIVAEAARMEDVQLTAYGNGQELAIGCGVRTPPDKAYVTWRKSGAGATAVAVEFMPTDYVP
jgi:tetratricopeptide (TPR) repeat protein